MIEEGYAATVEQTEAPSRWHLSEILLLLVLGAVQFTLIIDFVIVMPLGPQLMKSLTLTPQAFGWIVSSYAFTAAGSGLLAAVFMDRFDRKTALLFLFAGFILGTFLCAIAQGFLVLVLGRAVAGAFAGVLGANVLAIVGDTFPLARRGTAMGVLMSAFSVASIVGIPAGLVLANLSNWRTPFAVLGLLCLIVWVLAWRVLPPCRKHLTHSAGPTIGIWKVATEPAHVRAYALMVTLVLSTFVIFPYLSIYLVGTVGIRNEDLVYVWLCGGLATLVTTSLFGWLSDRFGKLRMFRILALLTGVPVVILANLPPVHLAVVLGVTTLLMVASSGRMVPAMALITASALPSYRGSFMSINSSVQQVAMGLGPLIGGLILGDTEGGGQLHGFPLVGILAAIFILLSVYLVGQLRPAQAHSEATVPPEIAVPQPGEVPAA
jgi:predicted MFS family arabinose efflux permease